MEESGYLSPNTILELSTERDEKSNEEGFAFILNVASIPGSREILPGHTLRKASEQEITVIKETLARLRPGVWSDVNWYELEQTQSGKLERLPSEKWRYFVIGFRGSNATLVELGQAFEIAKVEVEIGFTINRGELQGMMWHSGRFFQSMEESLWGTIPRIELTDQDLDEIRTIYSELTTHDDKVLEIKRLISQLTSLKALPRRSELQFLGYFAVLESVLTHLPNPTDPYDSITRQIKKKLALLNHRCRPPFNYQPFGGASEDSIWTKMYKYRSILAHGSVAIFDTGELVTLRNHETALHLLRESVKSVLRQALIEPQLLADLRDC